MFSFLSDVALIDIRLQTGPVLGFGPAGFLLTRTSAGPFFGPAPVHF